MYNNVRSSCERGRRTLRTNGFDFSSLLFSSRICFAADYAALTENRRVIIQNLFLFFAKAVSEFPK